jgi:hypothetical protein
MLYYELGHYDHLYLDHSYCNIYGTGYQLCYVYHNNDSGIVVEYITGISNSLNFGVLQVWWLKGEVEKDLTEEIVVIEWMSPLRRRQRGLTVLAAVAGHVTRTL